MNKVINILLKKLLLIQEFELNYKVDKTVFLENLKNEFDSNKRTKKEYVLDAFMSADDFLKASFNANSFVLRLVPDLWIRSSFVKQFKLVCKLEETNEGLKIKAKLFNDSHHFFMTLFIFLTLFIVLLSVNVLIEGDFIVLLGLPVFTIFFIAFYFYEKNFLERLKKSALVLFEKIFNKSMI